MPPKTPIKRELVNDSDSDKEFKPKIEYSTPSKKPRSNPSTPTKEKKPWTEAEERAFREGINNIVKKYLWAELKADPMIAKRGANGVSQHWIAMYKKL
ncbi:hypothetical protein IAT40_006304 [Kwoniella sp. CBS 6097]